MSLHSRCWPWIQASEGLPKVKVSASMLACVAVGRRLQVSVDCCLEASALCLVGDCTRLLMTWCLSSPDQVMRERERESIR